MCTGVLWRVCWLWVPPLPFARLLSCPGSLASPCLRLPRCSCRLTPPSSVSSWQRRGLRCLPDLGTCSVSWGPLRTAASLACRTCHSARNGSGSSIPASGGGGGSHGHRRSYCSLVLNALSLLFI